MNKISLIAFLLSLGPLNNDNNIRINRHFVQPVFGLSVLKRIFNLKTQQIFDIHLLN